MNYSELLQLAKGWGNFRSDRIIIWRLLLVKSSNEGKMSKMNEKEHDYKFEMGQRLREMHENNALGISS